jgi:D-alanyl-lipoteichoic acid acyltransferase DltB (MBOAT superfamily)
MSFLDPAFFLTFLPLTLAVFYLAGRWGGPRHAALVFGAASILFCAPFGWRFLGLTLASALVNWLLCAALIDGRRSSEQRRALFRTGVAINLLMLAVFKYVPGFTAIPAARSIAPALLLWVPITISFYTFQRLVLLADCYRREPATIAMMSAGKGGWQRFLAFTMSFPNLVIGPIAFASEVGPQLLARRFGRVRLIDLEAGLTLFVIGLFKKLVIADMLGMDIVDPVFMRITNGHPPAGPDVCVAILGYYAQLYFDFSGYSDMALGIARMFGIRLPFNFNSPLRAIGIVDFYRRWHITLTRIVARFLFQALSLKGTRFTKRRKWKKGSKRKLFELWLPLLVNFLVIGIWHGATWTFVVFGVIHGVWYIIETEVRAKKSFIAWNKRSPDVLRRLIGQAITIVPLSLTFSLFRSASVSQFVALVSAAAQNWTSFLSLNVQHVVQGKQLLELAVAFTIIWLLPNTIELLSRYRPGIVTFVVPSHTPRWLAFRWRPTLVWGLYVAVLMVWVIKARGAPAPFVYGGF